MYTYILTNSINRVISIVQYVCSMAEQDLIVEILKIQVETHDNKTTRYFQVGRTQSDQ